jgi:hypothetical protein
MIISLRQVSRFVRMLIFVVAFSFICFKLLGIVQDMIQPTNKYKEPVGGDALKVNGAAQVQADMVSPETLWDEMLGRLAVFYKIGE